MAPSFEVLPGLPGEGPYPEQFTTRGGTHREGFVVRVIPDRAPPWVGNFQPGYGGISRVVPHPDGRTLLVISRGLTYPIDPEARSLASPAVDDGVRDVCTFGEYLVLVGWFMLTVLGPGFRRWQTPPAPWDGFKDIRIEGSKLTASGFDSLGAAWRPIELDLGDGSATACTDGRERAPPPARSAWEALKFRVRHLLRGPGA